ncbi:glycerophosphodiester phosphodiesterase [Lactobacillus sp. CC-MHH1034]|uniref:glycerophosphodiester phosphodiesterase n=1 Tax=Agrilactobacillus fermenti TaxID=2586909 RepID=UPI001E43B250|nr:glycerophosphodiester phosphodiesterase [Agrilactobacillus fermenti]MCD2257234.1 glycerophosphodiester phosphodiesterase [Agrilactobacillus fermenti]
MKKNQPKQLTLLLSLFALLSVFYFTTGFTVVGHRGDPINAPEETFQSFDTAFSEGANYVELDLHRSQDGVLVISHDRNLQRVTGQGVIVSQMPFGQLQKLHSANGEPIHSLDELFAHYQNQPNTKFLLETKKTKSGNPKDMEALITAAVKKYHMENRVMIHSFSLESLRQMQTLLPNVPRIFIVGSLKRINFDALQYVTGINISSELVTPQLVDQLHYLGKQVYIWDEMTEKQQSWNKIVNLPIDGVVTNYPAVGASYQQSKDDARIRNIDEAVTLVSNHRVPTYENPYRTELTQAPLKPFQIVKATQVVNLGAQTYYQIGENRFVSADALNNADDLLYNINYLNKTLRLKPETSMQVAYHSPLYPQQTSGLIFPNQNYRIQAVRRIANTLWFKLASGWIQGDKVLVDFNNQGHNNDFALNLFLHEHNDQRPNNVDLLASLPSLTHLKVSTAKKQSTVSQQLTSFCPTSQMSTILYPLTTNLNIKG